MIILIILEILLLFLLLLLVLLVLTPIDYLLSCSRYHSFNLSGKISILFKSVILSFQWKQDKKFKIIIKIVGIPIHVKINKFSHNKNRFFTTNKDKTRNKEKSDNDTNFFLKGGFSLVRQLIHHIAPKTIKVKGYFGFDDPAATGITCAFLSFIPSLCSKSNILFSYTPVFDQEILEGEVLIKGRFIPAVVIWIILSQIRKEKKAYGY